ncbi:hypothetical protein Rsub_02326 [Raphidocelis subcapitata]|uniref:Uncharacterized protein n=1 Tax=Raphidocelis subcapitata TaxID=307507 RepID=A0A2V0NPQ1_9CHLO|nr:hypothetical protein Rsub_02326 [Raphidocelis subcapitata]|eukprot:GBF89608.1 hypothetical protein Rsub_02326 [Raphidocelis subcapitata]
MIYYGKHVRPSPDDWYDFRRFIQVGIEDNNGVPVMCDRIDYSNYPNPLRGLDFQTAQGPLAWAADMAGQQWYVECQAMPKCRADMAADKLTMADFKRWTKRTADKILEYLRVAPGGRNVLCPPRAFFGWLYQTFVRSPDPGKPFWGMHNWVTSLNPSYIGLVSPNGEKREFNALKLIQRAAELKYYVPEPLFAMEGLVEMLIGYDHALISGTTTASARAAGLSSDGSAPVAETADPAGLASADEWVSTMDVAGRAVEFSEPAYAMDEGPRPAAAFAEGGFVAGVALPELLKPRKHAPSLAGCGSGDMFCAARSEGLFGGGGGEGDALTASSPADDGRGFIFRPMAGETGCLDELRRRQDDLNNAKTLCSYRIAAELGIGFSPSKPVFDIDKPISSMQFDKAYAIYMYICSGLPNMSEQSCREQAGALGAFMKDLNDFMSRTDEAACVAGSLAVITVNVLTEGAAYPTVQPLVMYSATACIKVIANYIGDMGCSVVDNLQERYDKAVECCGTDCSKRPECALLGGACVPRINIPECGGGDGEPSTIRPPSGYAMPPASGPGSGGGDGNGNWGWGKLP